MRRGNKNERSIRLLRVGATIRHAVSAILQRDDIRDDDLRGVSITVTEADVSPDLRNAKVFVAPLGGKDQDIIVTALNNNAAYIRGQLGKAVHLKYLPKLSFHIDGSFDEAGRIGEILSSDKVKNDLDEGGS